MTEVSGSKRQAFDDPLNIATAHHMRSTMSGKIDVSPWQIFRRAQSVRAGLAVGAGLADYRKYLQCKNGPGGLNAEEFLRYGLVDRNIAAARRFVGNAIQTKLHAACNDETWFAVTKNKLLWHSIMSGAGFATAEIRAIYDKRGRGFGAPVLKNAEDLSGFLSQPENLPVFCKPVTGVYSIGAMRIDAVEDGVALINSTWKKPVAEIARYFEQIGKKGFILQSILRADTRMASISSGALSSLRVMVLVNGGEADVFRVVLKVPGTGQVADNFWRSGALLCALDIQNGRIFRAVCNTGKAEPVHLKEQVNEITLAGWQVPQYEAAIKLVTAASKYFPGIQTQSWDVALSDNGPVLLELNFGGDLGLLQMAHDEGVLNDRYRTHLERCGYRGKL